MTQNFKVSIVVVGKDGKPVKTEFKDGMGGGVLGSFEASVRTDEDGTTSPMGLWNLYQEGEEFRDDMVKVVIEKVENDDK